MYKQDGKEYKVHLARAPEPEDILWTNIGQKNFTSYMKKIFTFTITVILLGISFAIVFGLTKLQQSKNDDRLISIAISLTIIIVNVIIGRNYLFIQKLSMFSQSMKKITLKPIDKPVFQSNQFWPRWLTLSLFLLFQLTRSQAISIMLVAWLIISSC